MTLEDQREEDYLDIIGRKEKNLEPTERGKLNYPVKPIGYYVVDAEEQYACICKDNCPKPCKGDCGCLACNTAYNDYLSARND